MKVNLLSFLSIHTAIFFTSITLIQAQNFADWAAINADIITMKDGNIAESAEAIACLDGKIIYVGSNNGLVSYVDDKTVVKDLSGLTVLPGFVDPHNHIFTDARKVLPPTTTMEGRQALLFEQGITTIGDPSVEDSTLVKINDFHDDIGFKVKMNLYLIRNHGCGWEVGDWYKNHPVTIDKSQTLRVAGMKIFADGGSCGTFPAVDWVLPRGDMGDLFLSDEEMNSFVSEAHSRGYQVVVHAQGNRAIDQAQKVMSEVLGGQANSHRHRIDHNAFLSANILPEYSKKDIIPVCFAHFPTCLAIETTALEDAYGADHLNILEDWRSLFDSNPNWPIAWHSDAPFLSMNTIDAMYSYATRREINIDGDVCLPPDWLAEHAIEIQEILPMMTYHAAFSLQREHQVGSLEPGKAADLVILSDNPLKINKNNLHQLEILMTMASGERVYCSSSRLELCDNVSTSSNNLEHHKIHAFPNPFDHWISIEGDTKEALTYQIFNVNGQIVMNGTFNPDESKLIHTSELEKGSYFLKFTSVEITQVIKIVK